MSREDTAKLVGRLAPADSGRDAIHCAVVPVVAGQSFGPGQHVGVMPDGTARDSDSPVGVVDPFLKSRVLKGERFWLFLYPGSITSLRHVWTHPAFMDEAAPPVLEEVPGLAKAASEKWLRDFAATSDCPDYDTLIAAASGKELPPDDDYGSQYSNDGEFLHFNGHDAHGRIPDEFWTHVEIVSGKKIPDGKRAPFFSCSC